MRISHSTIVLLTAGLASGMIHAAEPVVGFRGDGSGNFPGANPPTRFSTSENLTWKADAGQGCGAVIIVGNKLFLQSAPNALVCLDKATGKELWRRTHHVGQLDPKLPTAVLDAAMDEIGEFHVLAQKSRRVAKEAMDRVDLEAQVKKEEARLGATVGQVPGARIGGYGCGGIYLICMTPCSDGERVVAVFPTGIAVAYDLTGGLLWSVSVRPPNKPPADYQGGWRPIPGYLSACPLMTPEGIIVVRYGIYFHGISATNGSVIWSRIFKHTSLASPVLGVVNGESFVGTDGGDVLRVRDGQIVHDSAGAGPCGESPVSPVFANGVFHWVTHATRVEGGPTPRIAELWRWDQQTLIAASRFGDDKNKGFPYSPAMMGGHIDFTSPVIMDDRLLYFNWGGINVIDGGTGKVMACYRQGKPSLKPLSHGVTKNWAYGGMIRAGKHLILIHDNGLVKIFPINDTFAPMQTCAVPDDVYAQPTCDDSALYIRSLNALWRFDNPTASIPATTSGGR